MLSSKISEEKNSSSVCGKVTADNSLIALAVILIQKKAKIIPTGIIIDHKIINLVFFGLLLIFSKNPMKAKDTLTCQNNNL